VIRSDHEVNQGLGSDRHNRAGRLSMGASSDEGVNLSGNGALDLSLAEVNDRTRFEFCRPQVRTDEGWFSGRGPVIALAAEFIPGVVFPSSAAVPDFAVDRKAATAAFGMKTLAQWQT
jgi:hypothetical protein